MKHIKDFKLYETGENPQFEDYEIKELIKLGFENIDGEYVYTNEVNTLIVRKDSTSYKGEIDEWFVLIVKNEKFINDTINNTDHFRKFKASLSQSKKEKFDYFSDLIKNIKKYL